MADAPFECITCSANGFASRGQSGRSSSEMDLCVSMPMQIELKKITTPWWWYSDWYSDWYTMIQSSPRRCIINDAHWCTLSILSLPNALCLINAKGSCLSLGGSGGPLFSRHCFYVSNCPQLSVTVNRSQPLTNLQGRPRRDSGEV